MRQPDHLHLSNSLQTPETFTSLLAALLIKEENTKNFLSGNNSETPKRSFSLRMAMADCSLSVSFFFLSLLLKKVVLVSAGSYPGATLKGNYILDYGDKDLLIYISLFPN